MSITTASHNGSSTPLATQVPRCTIHRPRHKTSGKLHSTSGGLRSVVGHRGPNTHTCTNTQFARTQTLYTTHESHCLVKRGWVGSFLFFSHPFGARKGRKRSDPAFTYIKDSSGLFSQPVFPSQQVAEYSRARACAHAHKHAYSFTHTNTHEPRQSQSSTTPDT